MYTTGEAARICHLSQQTIIRCFDNGTLEGFKIPGSKFRRIPHNSLAAFMRENNIPLDALVDTKTGVLIFDGDTDSVTPLINALNSDGRFEAAVAGSEYEAGILTDRMMPDIVLLDYAGNFDSDSIIRTLRQNPKFEHIKVMIASDAVNQGEIERLREAGAAAFIQKPYDVEVLINSIAAIVGE